MLWKARLPAAGHIGHRRGLAAGGKQYVVLTAGGHALLGTKLGDATIAYTLPGSR
jgi:quinoprotein glucose dehydrogenase